MKMRGRVASAALALSVALVAAGCSGDKDDDKSDTPAENQTSQAVDPDRVSPTDLPEVPEIEDAQGAVSDASFGTCTAAEGTQEVTGSVTNSTDEAIDYVVTVSWINDTSDVLARGVAVVEDLAAGESEDFTVSAEVPASASNCTFHVVRGSL